MQKEGLGFVEAFEDAVKRIIAQEAGTSISDEVRQVLADYEYLLQSDAVGVKTALELLELAWNQKPIKMVASEQQDNCCPHI